jgi:hypothetical protein
MGPLSYILSVVDRNVVIRRLTLEHDNVQGSCCKPIQYKQRLIAADRRIIPHSVKPFKA